jgi:cell division septum initiation protein DivIVA
MDIQHLVDRLEELVDEGRHVPMSKFTLIDEERALEIIDQMRISIPEEVEKANRVLAQRDRILAQANEEAARAVQLARERTDEMLDRDATVQAASNKASNIIEAARQEADAITAEADQYVLDTLNALEAQVAKLLTTIRNGIDQVATDGSAHPNEMGTAVTPAQLMGSRQPVQTERKDQQS